VRASVQVLGRRRYQTLDICDQSFVHIFYDITDIVLKDCPIRCVILLLLDDHQFTLSVFSGFSNKKMSYNWIVRFLKMCHSFLESTEHGYNFPAVNSMQVWYLGWSSAFILIIKYNKLLSETLLYCITAKCQQPSDIISGNVMENYYSLFISFIIITARDLIQNCFEL